MNIIYIHTHDTGRVISPYGYKVNTPNYQEFFEDSLLFQQAYSVAPTCSPSRAALLTGVYPHQNGMLGLAQRGFKLDYDLHLAKLLLNNGYHTALCGVQHEIGYYTSHEMAIGTLGYEEDLTTDHKKYKEEELIIWDKKNAENLSEWLKNYASDKPFFVSYGMHATHRKFPNEIHPNESTAYSQPPINLPNNEITREDYAKYKTSLRTADNNVGLIISTLKEQGMYENSIIIVTTDHGLAYPFAKCTLNDSGIGVLMAMRVPESKNKGNSYDGLISHIDVVPTLCDLIGIDKPDYLQGQSFSKIFKGENYTGNDAIFGEINFHTSYEPVRAVRTKRYKYIKFFDKDYLKINQSNIDNSPIKDFYAQIEHSVSELEKEEEYLFDLDYDVFEKNNVAYEPKYKRELNEMRERLTNFMIRTNDPLLDGPISIKKEWKVNKKDTMNPGSKNIADYESLGK
ncbi:sulfatase [Enterococcus saccharolyticus]|uniref:sulfatase family protein n=1 Tax=Enterococcus saccharolyticus TaxID=41997 RepID=UPI001E5D1A7B|nr:sulfatase [Enterococcus saccharolyticus]MCD5002375.1 sulfatase [Enterococcus saccharolyticus]